MEEVVEFVTVRQDPLIELRSSGILEWDREAPQRLQSASMKSAV
jgi:hypothetical protein